MKRHSCAIVVVAMLAGHSIVALPVRASVILNDGGVTNLEVQARDTNVSITNQTENLFPASLPFSGSHAAIHGNSNSQATYDLSQDAFVVTSFGSRDGRVDSRANVQPTFFFSVSVNTLYTLTGNLSTVDPSAKGVEMLATLTDIDSSTILFHNHQSSFGIANEAFVFGESNGNVNHVLTGSPTGVLLAGHRYSLAYGTSLYASDSGSPASFNGVFRFSFAAPVPEATALLTWMVLSCAVAALRHRG